MKNNERIRINKRLLVAWRKTENIIIKEYKNNPLSPDEAKPRTVTISVETLARLTKGLRDLLPYDIQNKYKMKEASAYKEKGGLIYLIDRYIDERKDQYKYESPYRKLGNA